MTPQIQSYRELPLTKGQVAIIDEAEFAKQNRFKWSASWSKRYRGFYAMRRQKIDGKGYTIYLHREILGLKHGDGLKVDHINSNGLDNRRENLRIATSKQNSWNTRRKCTSGNGFKGIVVRKHSYGTYYSARIRIGGKRIYLGCRSTPEAAYALYCEAAKRYFGEFACLD